jgi:hypothetical protein
LGGAVPVEEDVALRLVATPRWQKGADLNTEKLVFVKFDYFIYVLGSHLRCDPVCLRSGYFLWHKVILSTEKTHRRK